MILDNYTEDEFKDIVANSSSYADLAKRLGYRSYSGDLYNKLKEFFKDYDCSHFKKCSTLISRYPENVFIKNSTANQSTLRRWFIKGQYVDYKCSICGMKPIWNNKPLTLILDHINGVNNDDRLENLRWVCPNCNQQLPTTGRKNTKTDVKINYCIDCHKQILPHSIRCVVCNNKNNHAIIGFKTKPVSREELKGLLREKTFVDIGKLFNVSDNTIRNWCDYYNLPKYRKEIESYSDSEWEYI